MTYDFDELRTIISICKPASVRPPLEDAINALERVIVEFETSMKAGAGLSTSRMRAALDGVEFVKPRGLV